MKRTLLIAATALIGVGCIHREPVYVEQRQQPTYVVVTDAPPAQRIVEQRPPPPTRDSVWIDGYYSWNGRQYVWEPGHWAVPPHGFTLWIGPRYARDPRGYTY